MPSCCVCSPATPRSELEDAIEVAQDRLVVPFSEESGALLLRLEGLQLDDLARASARELRAGESPAPAELDARHR